MTNSKIMLSSLLSITMAGYSSSAIASTTTPTTVYVGTYTLWGTPPGAGIYSLNISPDGKPTNLNLAMANINPSYLIVKNNHLYAVNETEPGTISAFNITTDNHLSLSANGSVSSAGNNPVYLAADNYQRLFAANYGTALGTSSGISAFNLNASGTIIQPYQTLTYKESSIDPDRQGGSHTHSVNVLTINNQELLLSIDLGADKLHVYTVQTNGALVEQSTIDTTPGSGPRHLTSMENNGSAYIYVANELNSTIDVYVLNINDYSLKHIQNIISYNAPLTATRNYPAEIMLGSNHKYLYVSNRGMDNIAQFRVQSDGKLSYIDQYPAHGTFPRDFDIDPSGNLLVSANQTSGDLSIFLINQLTGALTFTQNIKIPSAVTIKFWHE